MSINTTFQRFVQLAVFVIAIQCCCLPAQAQLLSTSPLFAQDNSALTITVDCTKGNQGLLNYANTTDVYVHIGVITNLSTSTSDWKYVKTTWPGTDPAARATLVAPNRYQYSISDIRSYFGVPPAETILKVAILFRNGLGNLVQRTSDPTVDQGNMYIPVYSSAFAGRFTEPPLEFRYKPIPEPITHTVGDKIYFTWNTNSPATISTYFNGVLTGTGNAVTSYRDSALITSAGNQQLVARGTSGATTISDTINFFVAASVVQEPLPAGLRQGVNYEAGDTSVTLVLYAPNKTRVSLLGDFNNWIEDAAYQMKQTPDENYYWLRITGLTPGTEYAYQYLVNGNLKIADPYTHKVLDPNNDPYISTTTYPNLKPYPTGKTAGIVSVLQTAEPAYAWQVNNFVRPNKKGLVVYELLLRDFVAAHDWNTLRDTLTYLKALGINAIELMPINEFEGNLSWGYNPSFYFAPDKYYGTANSLKSFVDEAHKQGIAVILDIALNHSFGQSPMVQLYFDAINNRPAANNPWFNPTTRHAFNVGYDMNHESAATQHFVSRVLEHWLTEFRVDGFRFDLSKGFTQVNTCDANGNNCNVGAWGNYDASRVAIWKRYYDTLQLKSAGSYAILEHFADNSEEKELSDYGMLFWGNLNYNFTEAAMGFLPNSNFEGALHTVRTWSKPHLVGYMESHDEERLMYKNNNFGNSSGAYNVKQLSTGLQRSGMSAAFLLMMPGPKMIWQFGEWGYDYSINACANGTVNDNCRTDAKPIRWDYRQDLERKKLLNVYQGLLKLRAHPQFKNNFTDGQVSRSLGGAFKWLKLETDTSSIVVIGNFDVNAASGTVSFPQAGTWYDYFGGTSFAATGAAQNFSLAPGEYRVYINRNINNVVTPVTDLVYDGKKISLSVFPNPVKHQARLRYEIPETGPVTIRLVNMSGQQVALLYSGFRTPGIYELTGAGLNQLLRQKQGVYFVQLQVGQRNLVQKLVLGY